MVCDGSGLGAAWFLEYIAVTNSTTGVYAKFPYNGWLDEKAGWSHMLLPEGQGGAVSRNGWAVPTSSCHLCLPPP